MLLSAHVILSAIATLAIFPGVIASNQHAQRGIAKVHQKHRPVVQPRSVEVPPNSTHELEKRQRRVGHFSWYDTEESGNPGHCGEPIKNHEFVVAKQFGEFSLADRGKQIRIFYQGKVAVATIKDSCPGCWAGGFDMSKGLFQFFEWDAYRVGVIDTEWEWVGAEQPPPPPPPPPPTTTEQPWTPPPTPSSTSVWQAPSSSSVPPPPPPPSSSSVASSSLPASSSASAQPSGSRSVSGSARPTATPSGDRAAGPQGLEALSGSIVKMAFLITDGPAAT